jgi:hypothetical protein
VERCLACEAVASRGNFLLMPLLVLRSIVGRCPLAGGIEGRWVVIKKFSIGRLQSEKNARALIKRYSLLTTASQARQRSTVRPANAPLNSFNSSVSVRRR